MQLEEAIKVLQKTIKSNNEIIKEARKNGDINAIKLTADLDNQSIAIETVLQELEKLQKDNYKLDRENQKLFEININSIPKKKIEDKKEENSKLFFETKDVRYANRFRVLQELLEDK